MKASKSTTPFRKTAACPASATLLSFRCQTLSAEAEMLVTDHLRVCDFCNAELSRVTTSRVTMTVAGSEDVVADDDVNCEIRGATCCMIVLIRPVPVSITVRQIDVNVCMATIRLPSKSFDNIVSQSLKLATIELGHARRVSSR